MRSFFHDPFPENDDALVVPESGPLDTCIIAFTASLELAHPTLLSREPVSDREAAAALLHMHFDACRSLLRLYDHLTFGSEPIDGFDDDEAEQVDDDIPF